MVLILTACSFLPERPVTEDRGGAYYQDDGPPAEKGPDPVEVPNAVPREEQPSEHGNSPYTVFGKRYYPLHSARGYREVGEATWYGKKFHGRKTSSGEIYDMYKMTAAHKTLPLPTYVRVRRLDTNESVVVRVNDRGPFLKGRIIDLSYVAARKLGVVSLGKAQVEVVAIDVLTRQLLPKKTGNFLEAARFRLPENAENLRRRLLKKELGPVDIVFEESEGIVYYRVRIGPIAKNQSVDQYISGVLAETGVLPRKVSE
jgi:rare lipoprotein A